MVCRDWTHCRDRYSDQWFDEVDVEDGPFKKDASGHYVQEKRKVDLLSCRLLTTVHIILESLAWSSVSSVVYTINSEDIGWVHLTFYL